MKKLTILIALLIQIPIAHAYTECVPAQSTSTVTKIETQNFPIIVINEVSFKDTASDFVELYIKDDKNAGSGANIKGLEISSSEGVIQKIETDTIAKTGDFILYNATNGLVATKKVLQYTQKYKNDNDYYSNFVDEYIEEKEKGKIKWADLRDTFIEWYKSNYDTKIPNIKDIKIYFEDKVFKEKMKVLKIDSSFRGWKNYIIKNI